MADDGWYDMVRDAVREALLSEVGAADLVRPDLMVGMMGCVSSHAANAVVRRIEGWVPGRTYVPGHVARDLMVGLGLGPEGEVRDSEHWFLAVMGGPDGRLDVVLGCELGPELARYWAGHGWEPLP